MHSFRIPYLTTGHIKTSFSRLVKLLTTKFWVYPVWFAITVSTLFILLWLPNLSLLTKVLSSDLSIENKWDFLASTPEILSTSYTPLMASLLVIISVLQGLVVSLLIIFWRSAKNVGAMAASGAGVSLAALGASCSACGAGVLYPVLASIGVLTVSSASFFELLLMLVAVLVLLYSIHRTTLLIA
jgi:hypothetical protein